MAYLNINIPTIYAKVKKEYLMADSPQDTGLKQVHQPTVQKIATDIIEPALRKALAEARKEGSAQEVVNALANCYGGLLVDILGRQPAAAV